MSASESIQPQAPEQPAAPVQKIRSLAEIRAAHSPANPDELREVAQATAKQAGAAIEEFFDAHGAKIAALLPPNMKLARFKQVMFNAIRANPKLLQASVVTLFGACILAAQIGLEPNTHAGHLYLIPRVKRVKRGNAWVDGPVEVNVQIAYKGWIELCYRNPKISLIKSVAVYENDEFLPEEGTVQRLTHRPATDGDRGQLTHFYAVAKLDNGEWLFEVMTRSEVERIRDLFSESYKQSQGTIRDLTAQLDLLPEKADAKERNKLLRDLAKAKDTPWIRDFVEMGRKTTINRIRKFLPTTPQMDMAGALDNMTESEAADHLTKIIDGEPLSSQGGEPDAENPALTIAAEDAEGEGAIPHEPEAEDEVARQLAESLERDLMRERAPVPAAGDEQGQERDLQDSIRFPATDYPQRNRSEAGRRGGRR